jgi:hypothetical protein
LELPYIGKSLGEVGDELVFFCGLDNHIVDVGFDVFPIWDLRHF